MAFTTIPGSGKAPTTLVGTSGIDSVNIAADLTNNFFVGAQLSNDLITLDGDITRSNVTIKGGQGADTVSIRGVVNESFLNGNADNDIFGSIATPIRLTKSTLQGGKGLDTIVVSSADTSIVNGNKGIDTVTVAGVANTSSIRGGQGNDIINVGNAAQLTNSLISGDVGNDTITVAIEAGQEGFSTNSTVQGGAGNDTITATLSNSSVLLAGGDGNDTVTGGSSGDTLNGGAGVDTIRGNAGADRIDAGRGNDNILYFSTAEFVVNNVLVDDVHGGEGTTDSLVFNADTFTIGANVAWNLRSSGIERIAAGQAAANALSVTLGATASTAGITLIDYSADTNAAGANVIDVRANTGPFTITGGAGVETINAGQGNDVVDAGLQADSITGRGGSDEFIQNNGDSLAATAGPGALDNNGAFAATSTLTFGNGLDIITDFNSQNDTVNVDTAGAATLIGETAAATAVGNYFLRGGFANNVFTGAANGADILFISTTATNLTANNGAGIGTTSILLQGAAANFAANTVFV